MRPPEEPCGASARFKMAQLAAGGVEPNRPARVEAGQSSARGLPMSDPSPDPNPTVPPSYPEIDPASTPEEAPQNDPTPQEDDTGRPHDRAG